MAKKKAEEVIESTQATETPAPTGQNKDDIIQQLMAQNQQLMAALALNHQGKPAAEPKHRVVCATGSYVSFEVTNALGQKEGVHLAGRGEYKDLTQAQILEVKDRFPFLFEDGFISCPSLFEDNLNVVIDIQKFVDGLGYDEINKRISQITSPDTLWAIWNHIESKRFTAVDANDEPLKDKEGQPVMKELDLSAKETATALAVQRRITDLTNTRPSMG